MLPLLAKGCSTFGTFFLLNFSFLCVPIALAGYAALCTEGRAQGCSLLLQNNTFSKRHQVPPPALFLFCLLC